MATARGPWPAGLSCPLLRVPPGSVPTDSSQIPAPCLWPPTAELGKAGWPNGSAPQAALGPPPSGSMGGRGLQVHALKMGLGVPTLLMQISRGDLPFGRVR